jgi:hypothetical protein
VTAVPWTPEPLPELTLALRTLGSRRRRRGEGNEHERFFAPLLEARRAAARAPDVETAITAFDVDRLNAAFDKTLRALAAEHAASGRAAARRALEARLQERVAPIREAVLELTELADALLIADDEARPDAWRAWAEQLGRVFACADRCWPAVDAALVGGGPPRRGWLARLFRRRGS